MVNLKYGKIHCDVQWKWPTLEIYNDWKEDFLKIPNVLKYEIYLVGRFPDVLSGHELQTDDIDIVLIGNVNNIIEIEEIIYQGIKLGIEKYNVYVDILWVSALHKFDKNTSYTNTAYMHSDKWIIDGKVFITYQEAIQISENLWSIKCSWPSWKQQKRMNEGYIYPEPVKIN